MYNQIHRYLSVYFIYTVITYFIKKDWHEHIGIIICIKDIF